MNAALHTSFARGADNAVHQNRNIHMRFVKLDTTEGPIYVNPEHVVAVRKALKDTKIETVAGMYMVREEPEVVARLLGAEEIARDITAITFDATPNR